MIVAALLLLLLADRVLALVERQRFAAERARLVAAALAPTPQAATAALIVADAKRSAAEPTEPRHYPPAVGED